MQLTLHATRQTPQGASCLVTAINVCLVGEKPDALRPGIVEMRGSMVICMTTATHDIGTMNTPLSLRFVFPSSSSSSATRAYTSSSSWSSWPTVLPPRCPRRRFLSGTSSGLPTYFCWREFSRWCPQGSSSHASGNACHFCFLGGGAVLWRAFSGAFRGCPLYRRAMQTHRKPTGAPEECHGRPTHGPRLNYLPNPAESYKQIELSS